MEESIFCGDAAAEFLGSSGNRGCQSLLQPLGDATDLCRPSINDSRVFHFFSVPSFYQPLMSDWMIESVLIPHQTHSFKIPPRETMVSTKERD